MYQETQIKVFKIMPKLQLLVLRIYPERINGDFFKNSGIKLLKMKLIKSNNNKCKSLYALMIRNQYLSLCLRI